MRPRQSGTLVLSAALATVFVVVLVQLGFSRQKLSPLLSSGSSEGW